MFAHSPAAFDGFLRDAVQRLHQRAVGARVGDPALGGRRVCADVVCAALAARRVGGEAKAAIVAASCNALWTKARAAKSGYAVADTRCDKCGSHPDTLHGRLWLCTDPHVVAVRRAAATDATIAAAVAAGKPQQPGIPLHGALGLRAVHGDRHGQQQHDEAVGQKAGKSVHGRSQNGKCLRTATQARKKPSVAAIPESPAIVVRSRKLSSTQGVILHARLIAAMSDAWSAKPKPAMSNAVPWSTLVRTKGSPTVTLTPRSRPRYLTGINPWS